MHKNKTIEKKYVIKNVQISSIVMKMLLMAVESIIAFFTTQMYESLKTGRNKILRNKQIIQANISDYSIIEKRSCIRYSPQL